MHSPIVPFRPVVEALEPRRLLSGDDCGCGGNEAPQQTHNSILVPQHCEWVTDPDTMEMDWVCCDDANENDICDDQEDPGPEPDPDPDPDDDPDPEDPGGPGDPEDPEQPPNPPHDPCDDGEVSVNLVFRQMHEEDTPGEPFHETNPGGYLPLNRGFAEWTADTQISPQTETPPTSGLYHDYQRADRPITGLLPGSFVVLDPELRYGSVSVGLSGMTTPIGGVPFSFDVPEGVGLWIFYDEDTSDDDPAAWVRVGSGTFYAGGERDWTFNLTYEGEVKGTDKLVTAHVGGGSFCPDLTDEDSVLLHVIDTSADADADNDGGFAPDDPDAYTLADQWLEWAHQQYNREVAGKLGMINDGDLDYLATGDGLPDYADGFDWFSGPDSDPRDDLMLHDADPTLHQFVPVKVILPGRSGSSNQRIRFWFEYDSADPTYIGNDPQDLRHWYDGELQRHYWELGPEGSMRLWTQPAHVRRNWWGINEEQARPGESTSRGHFIDSTEWDSSSASQERVYYTHEDFFGSDAATAWAGGEVTLFLELLRPSAVLAGSSIKLHVTYEQFDGQSNVYAPYGFAYMQIVPLTAMGVDLDVDADNDDKFLPPSGDSFEDVIEDRKAGKLLIVNRDDNDNDRIIDYADGFGAFANLTNGDGASVGEPTPHVTPGERFVPLVLTLNRQLASSLGGATLTFYYDASDPAGVSHTSQDVLALDGTTVVHHRYSAGDGLLRLWRSPGDAARSLDDYVAPGSPFDVAELFVDFDTLTLYVEAVNGSATPTRVRVELQYGIGPLVTDIVRFLPLDPLIGIEPGQQVEGYNIMRGDGSTLLGTPRNDILIGTSGYEEIDGDAGDDIILAGRNAFAEVQSIDDPNAFAGDTIDGGAGSDLIFAWFGNNTIVHDPADELSRAEGHSAVVDTGGEGAQLFADGEIRDGSAAKPFTSEDIEAAYAWMYGVNDIWLSTFKDLGGRVLAVAQDGRWFSKWTTEWHQEYRNGPYLGYDIRIEYRVESVMHAAAILREGIMTAAYWDSFRWGRELLMRIADLTVEGSPEEDYQTLRQRNFDYAKEVASLAANLYVSGMTLAAGPGGDIADVVITLADLFSEDTVEWLLDMLPLVPGNLSAQSGANQMSFGPNLFVRARVAIESATGRKFVLGPNANNRDALFAWNPVTNAARKVGVVLRRDLLDGDAVSPRTRPRFNADRTKVSLLIGTAQDSGGTHAATINRIGEAMARGEAVTVTLADGTPFTIPARAYSHGTLNRAWRTATGRVVGSAERPDLIFVGEDGKTYAIEVLSPGQRGDPAEVQRLRDEMNAVLETIDPDLRGDALVLDMDA